MNSNNPRAAGATNVESLTLNEIRETVRLIKSETTNLIQKAVRRRNEFLSSFAQNDRTVFSRIQWPVRRWHRRTPPVALEHRLFSLPSSSKEPFYSDFCSFEPKRISWIANISELENETFSSSIIVIGSLFIHSTRVSSAISSPLSIDKRELTFPSPRISVDFRSILTIIFLFFCFLNDWRTWMKLVDFFSSCEWRRADRFGNKNQTSIYSRFRCYSSDETPRWKHFLPPRFRDTSVENWAAKATRTRMRTRKRNSRNFKNWKNCVIDLFTSTLRRRRRW